MPAKFLRSRIISKISKNADLSDPQEDLSALFEANSDDADIDEALLFHRAAATTTTITTSSLWATNKGVDLFVFNTGLDINGNVVASTVNLNFDDRTNTLRDIRIPAGKFVKISRWDPAGNIVLSTPAGTAPMCVIAAWGSS